MADLPSGAVTFLFTDIEGSTRLVKQLRERYGEVLQEHQRLLRAAFAAHDGYEVDTQGDSFFVAFSSARDALLAAVEGQLAISSHSWPDGVQIKVRMGLHTGQAIASGRSLHGARRPSGGADRRRRARRADPRLAGDADPPRGRGGGSARLPPGSRRAAAQGPRSARCASTRRRPTGCRRRSRRSAATRTLAQAAEAAIAPPSWRRRGRARWSQRSSLVAALVAVAALALRDSLGRAGR